MLSFGQRKRVAIAGIVAMQPRYLLLDEPSAGLDPIGVTQEIASLIAGQRSNKMRRRSP
jgi:cobalt/nickel transport system ATP-binding protein